MRRRHRLRDRPGDRRAIGRVTGPREIGRAAHRLADAVEAGTVRPGSAIAEGGDVHQDDIGFDRPQAAIVEPAGGQRRGRNIADDDVSRKHQSAQDFAALLPARIERKRALVAVGVKKDRAIAAVRHRTDQAVFAAAQTVDADNVCPEIRQQRSAIGAGDIATEIDYANSIQRHHCLGPRYACDMIQSQLHGGGRGAIVSSSSGLRAGG